MSLKKMKLIRLILAAASALLLTLLFACGGGGSGTSVPTIVTQPVSQTVTEGKAVTFMVTASGDAPLSYQWRRNGVAVAGATQSQYSFVPQLSDSDSLWSVAVGNSSSGVAVSQAAKLTVSQGAISLLAGDLAAVSDLDFQDGVGAQARFHSPSGLAFDKAGNAFVIDGDTVRKVTPDGTVTTLAGMRGQQGTIDGIGSAARFTNLACISIDNDGTLYVVDLATNVYDDGGGAVRKITIHGAVTTVNAWANKQISNAAGYSNGWNYRPQNFAIDAATGIVYVFAATSALAGIDNWVLLKIAPIFSNEVAPRPSSAVVQFSRFFTIGTASFGVRSALKIDKGLIYVYAQGYNGRDYFACLNSNGEVVSGLENTNTSHAQFKAFARNALGVEYWGGGSESFNFETSLTKAAGRSASIGTLSSTGEYSAIAGSPDLKPVNDPDMMVLGDLPGQIGVVKEMAFGPDGMLYVLANNAVLRIRVP